MDLAAYRGHSKWRVGTKLGRTIYAIVGERSETGDCSDEEKMKDVFIGIMDTPLLAERVVYDHNRR